MRRIDRILFNGSIVTLDANQSRVSALAVAQGRIIAVGTDDDILGMADSDTSRENLGGKFVIPGLTDAHIHWEGTARALDMVNVFEVPDNSLALARVADRVSRTPVGQWIIGYGWSQDLWPEKRFPVSADLDSIAPHHPVFLTAKSGHAAWVNSLALRLCGITSATLDPEGGQLVRDASGQITGILLENAINLISRHVPVPTLGELANQMKAAQQLALAAGLTGIHDFDQPSCLRALQLLRERGELNLRVLKNINKEWLPAALDSGLRWGFGDEWIRIGGLKVFADGALGPRTAAMVKPFENEPTNYGIVTTEKEEMIELVSRASAAGLPSTIHAIGDRAVHDVLDVYEHVRREESARGELTATRRHRIEHVQLIHPTDAKRLAQLNIIASMQPIHATSDMLAADEFWGKRSQWAYNARLQLDQGVVVAFGSDAPVEPFEPLKGIYAAVTRQRPDGSPGPDGWHPELRLTVDEALRAFTIGPAYAAGLENEVGKLAPGYLADLVVLDRDLYTVPPPEILSTQVMATMVGGEWRYGGV